MISDELTYDNGIDGNNTELNFSRLLSIHIPPYLDSIVVSVMVGYSSWNGKKMHANRDLLTGFLKNKLKFKVIKIEMTYSMFVEFG